MLRALPVVLVSLALAGCYQARVELPVPSAPQRTHTMWAHSWVFGLVPPATVNAASICPNGAARVETGIGFGHGLVGMITGGIYTPMEVRVQCAAH